MNLLESVLEGEKINDVTLDQLRMSRVERTVSGAIASEVTSIDSYDQIAEILDKKDIPFKVNSIKAINNRPNSPECGISISKELEERYEPGDIRTMLLKRLFMTIAIDDGMSDETNGNIVISYHQSGIEVAFGDNVHVCSNLCILGGEVVRNYSLYGNKSIPWKNIIEVVSHWIDTYEQRRRRNIEISRQLREIETTSPEIESFIGGLTLRAARHTTKKDLLAPLNISQIFDISKSTAGAMIAHDGIPDWNIPNAWELYNRITRQHKIENIDSSLILYQNSATFDVIKQQFKLEHEEIPVYG
jgi:hypothetical protein